MPIHFINDQQVAELLDYASVRHELQSAFKDLAAGQAAIFPRSRTDCDDIKLSAMGAIWQARGVAGIKAYPTVTGKFSFLINLFDLVKNAPLAVLEANEITRFRTAALTALVASHAAIRSSRKLALIGAGVQGQAIAKAVSEVFKLDQICIVDPVLRQIAAGPLASQYGVPVQICSAEEAVREADIIVTASRSKSPVFDGSWLKPGAFVSAVGTSLPNGRELDDATMQMAARVLVEWKPQSLVEAGEIVLSKAQGSLAERKILDLPELYRQEAAWRADDQEIVVFKSVGVGLADVATAWLTVQRVALQASNVDRLAA